ncbi:MAG: UMP kinase, partial [Thermoplasmata archaeon]|nr:UMP kinase [Thermoplasmata archaeon]
PRFSIGKLARLLTSLLAKYKLFVVVGGGRISRYYIDLGRKFGANEHRLDEMGIEVTRLNARILIAALGAKANPVPARSIEEGVKFSKRCGVLVMGGTTPGHTTDAVAAMLAESVGAERLVNATSVDGIYESDPKKNRKAKRIEKMSYRELLAITKKYKGYAGPNIVFDPLGASIMKRSRIPLFVVDGCDLKNLRAALEGKSFHGTVVR